MELPQMEPHHSQAHNHSPFNVVTVALIAMLTIVTTVVLVMWVWPPLQAAVLQPATTLAHAAADSLIQGVLLV